MKKRVVSLLLVMLLVMTLIPTGALAYSTGVGYKVTGGNIYISSGGSVVGCDETVTEAIIPSYAWNIKVTGISSYAFQDSKLLKSVKIPNTVTKIGQSAFEGCSQLESVELGNGLLTIESRAFEDCLFLEEIIITDNVISIGDWAFDNCVSLKKVVTRKGLQTIGYRAFHGCKKLNELTIGKNVKVIEGSAFYETGNIKNIYYAGSQDDWKQVYVGKNNNFSYCKWHYNYDPDHTHSYTAAVIAPTCTEEGYTTYTCSCGYSYKDNWIDALGHSYANGSCTRCGASDPNYKPAVSFVDVPSDAFYANAVKWAVENEITTGVGNNRFDPNGQCTRGQVVTFLWRAAGKPIVSADVSFSDVQPGAFYYEAVKWAVANGITTGVGGNRFAPNDSCTRGQVVTFLHRAANSPSVSSMSSFTDVPATTFYYNAVNWAVANGITNGTGNGRFSPNDTCTRGQVVTFLYRAQ